MPVLPVLRPLRINALSPLKCRPRSTFVALVNVRVATGLVSAMPIVDLTKPEERERLWAAAEVIHEAAVGLGGTIGGSAGTGLLRTPWLVTQAGPLLPIYRELKRIYDPKNLLNPGKLIDPDADLPAWPLPDPPTDAAGKSVPLVLAPLVMPSADAAGSRRRGNGSFCISAIFASCGERWQRTMCRAGSAVQDFLRRLCCAGH